MADSVGTTLKRFVLWDYSRGTWQYEVMVTLILAFIFLTPREFFRDQPKPKNVVMVTTGQQETTFLIDPHMLAGMQSPAIEEAANRIIHSQAGGKKRNVVRVEPVFDDEKEIRGFLAYTKP
ncbi:MAG: hypothetical protein FJW39_13910 [Acidobacteria bacterium]|nr:hypothetical protein [Acidobacteriota bacterium]